jgi:hypothetical protein
MRVGPFDIAPDSESDAEVLLPPSPAGAVALRVRVSPEDRLPFDQERFEVFETAPRPGAWIVAPREDADLGLRIVENLLAPEALEAELRVVSTSRVAPESLAEALASSPAPAMVVTPADVPLAPAAREAFRGYLEGGGLGLLIPSAGMLTTAPKAATPTLLRFFTTGAVHAEPATNPHGVGWTPDSVFASDPELRAVWSGAAVRARLKLDEPLAAVTTHARYSDEAPALLERRIGAGRLLLLGFSPDPRWSNLGVQASGLLTWLHELLRERLGPAERIARFEVGEESRRAFPGLPSNGTAYVLRLGDEAEEPAAVRVEEQAPLTPWPTERPGAYAIHLQRAGSPYHTRAGGPGHTRVGGPDQAPAGSPLARYTVNWPAEESDLRPIELAEVRDRLGVTDLLFVAHGAALPPVRVGGAGARLEPHALLTAILVGLLLAEVWLAARSRRAAQN